MKSFDLEEATICALEYVGRSFVAGLVVIPFAMGMLPAAGLAIAAIFLNCAGAIVAFPGAILLNVVRLRKFSSRCPSARRPRLWAEAPVVVVLTWVGHGMIAFVPIGPAEMLRRLLGIEGAWVLHVGSWMVAASTLGLLCCWACRKDVAQSAAKREPRRE